MYACYQAMYRENQRNEVRGGLCLLLTIDYREVNQIKSHFYTALGTGHWALGTGHWELGTWYLALGTWHLLIGIV